MEKILWCIADIVLLIVNFFVFAFCFAADGGAWAILILVIAGLDVIYIRKHPVWLEV